MCQKLLIAKNYIVFIRVVFWSWPGNRIQFTQGGRICMDFLPQQTQLANGNGHLFKSCIRIFLEDICPFQGPLGPLFQTSGDICPGFQRLSDSLTFVLSCQNAMDFSDSPLAEFSDIKRSLWQLISLPTYLCMHWLSSNMCRNVTGQDSQLTRCVVILFAEYK